MALVMQEDRFQPLSTPFLFTDRAFEAISNCPQPPCSQEVAHPSWSLHFKELPPNLLPPHNRNQGLQSQVVASGATSKGYLQWPGIKQHNCITTVCKAQPLKLGHEPQFPAKKFEWSDVTLCGAAPSSCAAFDSSILLARPRKGGKGYTNYMFDIYE